MAEEYDTTGADSNETAVPEADCTAEFQPLYKLEAVSVKTGEEEEDCVYTQRCRVYRFDNKTDEWKERGTGDIKMLQHKASKRTRLILRQEKTMKLVVNHELPPTAELTPNLGSDRAWTYATTDYSDPTPCVCTLAIKFKNPETANEFKSKFEEYRALNRREDAKEAESKSSSTDANVWTNILKERQFSRLQTDDVKKLWDKYDVDHSNNLDQTEVGKLLGDLFEAVTAQITAITPEIKQQVQSAVPALVQHAFATLDLNQDQKISFEEFQRLDEVKLIHG